MQSVLAAFVLFVGALSIGVGAETAAAIAIGYAVLDYQTRTLRRRLGDGQRALAELRQHVDQLLAEKTSPRPRSARGEAVAPSTTKPSLGFGDAPAASAAAQDEPYPASTGQPAAHKPGAQVLAGWGPKRADPVVSPPGWPSAGEPAAEMAPPARAGTMVPDLARSLADLEERVTGRALAWVGGVALVLGAIFFLSLAFSRNWIGPEGRVVIGLIAGAVSLAGGAVLIERGNRLLGHVLTPLGLAVISISLVGATRLYALIPVELSLALALGSTAATAAIAIRANSQVVAGFGLVAVLAAPPLLGAAPDLVTLAFVGVALVGTTAIALWRTWSWLPPVAFLLAAPQAASWMVGRPDPSAALPASLVFWVLNVVGAGGEEFRSRRNDLSPSAASLLVANAAFLVWSGFAILGGDLESYRGAFLVVVALAHLSIGGYFIARDGDANLFGLLVIGTGLAALTMAAPVQLGAPWVPVAWTAEAVALAWVAVRRAHIYGAIMSATLYVLAAAYLVTLLYPLDRAPAAGIPFANGPGGALAFFLASLGAGVWIVGDRSARAALAAVGLLVAAWCASIELAGSSITVALAGLTAIGVGFGGVLPTLRERSVPWRVSGLIPRSVLVYPRVRPYILGALPAAVLAVGAAATTHLVAVDYGSAWAGRHGVVPFLDPAGAGLLAVLVSLGLAAAVGHDRRLRDALTALGILLLAWACVRELDGVALVAAWAALAVAGLAARSLLPMPEGREGPWERLRHSPSEAEVVSLLIDNVLPGVALVNAALAIGHVVSVELPLASFGQVVPPALPFSDAGAAVATILVVAALAAGPIVGSPLARRNSIIAAGAIIAYTVPYEVYAWAVAVLWAAIAVAAVVGARRDRNGERVYLGVGLGMLMATGVVALGIVAPPSRLAVIFLPVEPIVALQSAAALASLVIALGLFTWLERSKPWTRWAEIATGLALVYLLSVAVVDVFATRGRGALATEELQKQGQVGLSVIWALSGVVAFVAGLRLRRLEIRLAGLALLAVATAKVFLFDLSALDVAYRVVSLMALGLILLVSAALWQRMRPPPAAKVDAGQGAHGTTSDTSGASGGSSQR